MHSKKEIKQRKKHMASFMTAKSTAKLTAEIEDVLSKEIPDPQSLPPAFDFSAPVIAPDERVIDEDLVDTLDIEEKAEAEDENSARY